MMLGNKGGDMDMNAMIELQQDLKSKDAEIAYLEAQIRKKDDENIKLKAEKEMLMIDSMNNQSSAKSSGQQNFDSIKRYESVIETLNKKIQYMEISAQKSQISSQDGDNLDWMVYHKFNKNLKDRLRFINKIMDWTVFSDDLTGQKK